MNKNEKSLHSNLSVNNDVLSKLNFYCSQLEEHEVQAYCMLVMASLNYLYCQVDENNQYIQKFFHDFLKEKNISEKKKKSLKEIIGEGLILDPVNSYASAFFKTSIYKNYKFEIIVSDLLACSIYEGVYDARSRTVIKWIISVLLELEKKIEIEDSKKRNGSNNENKNKILEENEKLFKRKSNYYQNNLKNFEFDKNYSKDKKNKEKNFKKNSIRGDLSNSFHSETHLNNEANSNREIENIQKSLENASNKWNSEDLIFRQSTEDFQLQEFNNREDLKAQEVIRIFEDEFYRNFFHKEYTQSKKEVEEKNNRKIKRKLKKFALIGLASLGGGILLGVTAGMATPIVASGLGLASGAIGSALFATQAGIAVVGSLFGAAGAGLTGHKMQKRIGDIHEFEFEELTCGSSLSITIAISGWINESFPDFRKVWAGLDNSHEQYTLRYESKIIRELGDALKRLAEFGISFAISEGLKQTVLNGLLQAMTWPLALLNISDVIDNPWNVCTQRTSLTGKYLAEVLLAREQGNRPITLIGFGLGARVIFSCLQEMSERPNCEGVIEEAILIGAPVTADSTEWAKFGKVVSGRLVNVYSRTDWMLKFIFRTISVQPIIAGLQPIEWNHRIMKNCDITSLIGNHFDYMQNIDKILEVIGVRVKPHVLLSGSSKLGDLVTHKQQLKEQDNLDNSSLISDFSKKNNTEIFNKKSFDDSETKVQQTNENIIDKLSLFEKTLLQTIKKQKKQNQEKSLNENNNMKGEKESMIQNIEENFEKILKNVKKEWEQ